MKKIITLLALIAFTVGIGVLYSDMAFAAAKDKEKAPIAPEVKKPAEEKKEESKVVCKFKTKDDMAAFEQLYVAKQATFGRMGVLQAYFAMEQGNLQEIDKQMEEKFKFKMDINKMYDLNRDTMELKEVGNVLPPAAQQDERKE